MFHSVRTYVYDRRRGLCKSAAVVGGVYLVKRYISDRLEEVKNKVIQERAARDKYISISLSYFTFILNHLPA